MARESEITLAFSVARLTIPSPWNCDPFARSASLRRCSRRAASRQCFAPPYDQINPAKQDVLYAQAPENIVRIISRKPDGDDLYAGAAKTLADWLADGTLEKERRPALWIYRQTFTDGGQTYVRDALVGLVKLAEYESGVVRPHERTLAKPKADRLALLAATKADLELVFLMTRAPLSAALSTRRVAQLTATDPDGVRHDAFRISDYAAHVELQGLVEERGVDHRRRPSPLRDCARVLEGSRGREAARRPLQALRDRGHGLARARRAADPPPDLGPAQLESREAAGVCARLLRRRGAALRAGRRRGAAEAFAHPAGVRARCAAGPARPADALGEPRARCRGPRAARRPGRGSTSPPSRSRSSSKLLAIDTDAIARGEHVSFTSDTAAALAAVEKKEAQAAVLMRPTTVADVEAVVSMGDRLPQKSTHFFPKMYSGIFGVSLEEPVY